VVRENVLYRCGQLTLTGLKEVIHDKGIKTVVTLRDRTGDGDGSPDLAEEEYCRAQEINYYRIPPAHWESADAGPPPVEKGVKKFRAIMADPANYPVLVHCFAGVHRTGAYCAIYRMEFEHWTNAEAIAEVKALGYSNLDEELDVLGYLEHYCPTWKDPVMAAPTGKTGSPRNKRKPGRPRRLNKPQLTTL
jgi:protein tyrosine/serine phosphatase